MRNVLILSDQTGKVVDRKRRKILSECEVIIQTVCKPAATFDGVIKNIDNSSKNFKKMILLLFWLKQITF